MRQPGREDRALLALVALVIFLLSILALAASSEARCGLRCLSRQVEALRRQQLPLRTEILEAQVKAQGRNAAALEGRLALSEAQASSLRGCLGEIPLVRYGEEQGPSGYLFRLEGPGEEPQTLPVTALDIARRGDEAGAWGLVDACRSEALTQRYAKVRPGRAQAARFCEPRTVAPALRW